MITNSEKYELEMKLMNEFTTTKKFSWHAVKSLLKLCAVAEN